MQSPLTIWFCGSSCPNINSFQDALSGDSESCFLASWLPRSGTAVPLLWCLEQMAGPQGLAEDLVGIDQQGSPGLGCRIHIHYLHTWAWGCLKRLITFGRAC